MNAQGNEQASQAATALADQTVTVVYFSPCQGAEETANVVAQELDVKAKVLKNLYNLDHGLWQGKLIEEIKEKQKKVYRKWQEQPETVCPPEGEMVSEAQGRVKAALDKLVKKHRNQVVVLVAPEPLTSLMDSYLQQTDLGDLWDTVCSCGKWLTIDVEPKQLATMAANQT